MKYSLILLITLSSLLIKSCRMILDSIDYACGICLQQQVDMMQKIREGDIGTLKTYLENGGDPEFECYNMLHGHILFGSTDRLIGVMFDGAFAQNSKPLDWVNLYLRYNNDQKIKNKFLMSFVNYYDNHEADEAIITLQMIDSMEQIGGRYFDVGIPECLSRFWGGDLRNFQILDSAGYNFNYQNEVGETILMQFVNCTSETSEEAAGHVKILKFLIDHGARTDIKNNDGKTAKDLATDPKVKAFLERYEKVN